MNDTDYMFAWIQRIEDFLAELPLGDGFHEGANDIEAYIGFQKSLFDKLQAFAHIRFRQLPFAAKRLNGRLQTVL